MNPLLIDSDHGWRYRNSWWLMLLSLWGLSPVSFFVMAQRASRKRWILTGLFYLIFWGTAFGYSLSFYLTKYPSAPGEGLIEDLLFHYSDEPFFWVLFAIWIVSILHTAFLIPSYLIRYQCQLKYESYVPAELDLIVRRYYDRFGPFAAIHALFSHSESESTPPEGAPQPDDPPPVTVTDSPKEKADSLPAKSSEPAPKSEPEKKSEPKPEPETKSEPKPEVTPPAHPNRHPLDYEEEPKPRKSGGTRKLDL